MSFGTICKIKAEYEIVAHSWEGGMEGEDCLHVQVLQYCFLKQDRLNFCLVHFGRCKVCFYSHQQSWKILLFGAINLICIGFLLMWCSSTNSIGRWLSCTEVVKNYHVSSLMKFQCTEKLCT